MEETTGKIMEDNRHWYVIYTSAKSARKVKEQLDEAKVENYLPLQSVVRLWNDGKKEVMISVVPGCLFVRIAQEDVAGVASAREVSFLLNEGGEPVTVADEDMSLFDSMVGYSGEFVEFVPAGIPCGTRVRVTDGQMEGQRGELVECEGQTKLVARLGSLGCALVDMPAAKVKPCD